MKKCGAIRIRKKEGELSSVQNTDIQKSMQKNIQRNVPKRNGAFLSGKFSVRDGQSRRKGQKRRKNRDREKRLNFCTG